MLAPIKPINLEDVSFVDSCVSLSCLIRYVRLSKLIIQCVL